MPVPLPGPRRTIFSFMTAGLQNKLIKCVAVVALVIGFRDLDPFPYWHMEINMFNVLVHGQ